MYGIKIEDMKVNGRIIRCMDMVSQYRMMEENTKDSMSMIKSMALGRFIGQMEGNIMVLGKMVSNMVEVNIMQFLGRKS